MPLTRVDLVPAVGVAVAVQAELWLLAPSVPGAIAGLGVLVLGLRRTAPVAVAIAVVALLVADAALGGVLVARLLSPVTAVALACLALGLHARDARSLVAVAVAVGAAMVAAEQLIAEPEYSVASDVAFYVLLVGATVAAGRLMRERQCEIEQLDQQVAELRAARREQAARAIVEERDRVAASINATLAERVGQIMLELERVGLGSGRGLAALHAIEAEGRAALVDLRGVIGVLRHDDHPAPVGPIPEAPLDAGPARLDLVTPVAVFAAMTAELVILIGSKGSVPTNVVGIAAVSAPLALRRRAPLVAALSVFLVAIIYDALLTPLSVLVSALALLVLPAYSVAVGLTRGRAITGLVGCLAGTLAIDGLASAEIAPVVLAWLAGRAVRDRNTRRARLRETADALDRSRAANEAHARAIERLRISRDLHDAVAHSMTVVVLQAGAARHVWERDPPKARAALAALEDATAGSLAELRRGLQGEARGGLTELDDLVERVSPLGLDVTIESASELPPQLDELAFCVVQEALTNAARYAAPASVRVQIHSSGNVVVLEIVDQPRAIERERPLVAGTGSGLRGLAERVAAHGGELRYGATAAGFSVRARLPS